MYYVGIDVAKSFHIACVLGEDGNLLKKNFRINSKRSSFDMLYQLLDTIDKDRSKFLIGMEATGLLFENLYIYLQTLGYNVVLLNPYRAA